MARTGYIATELAVSKLFKVIPDRKEASRLLGEALIGAHVTARGRPHIESEVTHSDVLTLRDLGEFEAPQLGPMQVIPAKFWKEADAHEHATWDFEAGWATGAASRSQSNAYQDIKVREKDVHALVATLVKRASTNATLKPVGTKKERLRDPSWEEWVAALATLAHEHQIFTGMKQGDLLDLINARLNAWDLGTKDPTTVRPTARKVLERFTSNPPHAPYPAGTGSEKP